MNTKASALLAAIIVPAAVLTMSPALSQNSSDFYRNKTITLVSPTGAGGSFSIAAQLLAAHLRDHIPGKPNIIVEHRPGASGAISANYLYNAAPQDGTVLGMPLTSFILTQYLQTKSVRYDAAKFKYIGRVTDNHRVLVVSAKSKAQTLEDLKNTEVPIGASGKYSTTNLQPILANALLKTRFRTVLGYSGGATLLLALERGEIDALTIGWETLVAKKADELKDGRIKIVLQMGLVPKAEIEAPSFIDFVSDPDERRIVEFISHPSEVGISVMAPPKMPDRLVAIIRQAFDATMEDPAFIADAKKRRYLLNPQPAAKIEAIISKEANTPKHIIAKYKKLSGLD